MTLQTYQGKLQEIVGKMFALLPSIRKENRTQANEYLTQIYMSTATIYNSVNSCYINAGLQARFQSYVETEENRLKKNLEAVDYDIDGLDTLELIVGQGRIEKVLYHLMSFRLKRHIFNSSFSRYYTSFSSGILRYSELHAQGSYMKMSFG